MNSIRYLSVASLPVRGEACIKCDPFPWHPPVNAEHGADRYGWSGNVLKDICVNGESCMERQRSQGRAMQQSEPPYELGSLVTQMEQREVGK